MALSHKDDFTVDVDFQDDGSDDTFMNIIFQPLKATTLAGIASGFAQYEKSPSSDLTDTIDQALQSYCSQLITEIDTNTRFRVNNIIQNSIDNGKTLPETKQALLDEFNSPTRAQMIARTETVNAYANGRDQYAQNTGAITKEWETQSSQPCDDCLL